MKGQITVGFDGTGPAFEAVEWAAGEASARKVPLRLVSCYGVPSSGLAVASWPATGAVASLLETTQTQLDAVRDKTIKGHPDLQMKTELSPEPAFEALLDGTGPGDLIVVGASGHHGAAAFWLGSTPRMVARRSPCPVVVVRGTASRGRPDRVVVGVDGSPMGDRAVLWAADEADLHHVPLVVVHAWRYPYAEEDFPLTDQARDLTEADAGRVLDRSVELATERCGADVSSVLAEGNPVDVLLENARDGDLLVLGSRGRGEIISGLFGSTVNGALERAAVPVVVVRGAKR